MTGLSCCSDKDCRPAAVWREGGEVWTRLNGQIVRVPSTIVLPDRMNRQPLNGHLCEANGALYCALVGGAGG